MKESREEFELSQNHVLSVSRYTLRRAFSVFTCLPKFFWIVLVTKKRVVVVIKVSIIMMKAPVLLGCSFPHNV